MGLVKGGGAPFARGFQHGYLVGAEYADAIRVSEAMTYQTMGFDYNFFVAKAVEYHKDKITPELMQEFDADEFLRLHPQSDCQSGHLYSRPSQPWTLFEGGVATR